MSASPRFGTLTTFLHYVLTGPTLTGDFLDMLPQRARDRVRPDLLPAGEVEQRERLNVRRTVRAGYREAQR